MRPNKDLEAYEADFSSLFKLSGRHTKDYSKREPKKNFFFSLSPHALGDSRSALTFPVFLKGYGLNADAYGTFYTTS